MKKMFYLLALVVTMLITSCETQAQVIYDEYYDYDNHVTVVYVNSIPYYRIWEHNMWVYRQVPYHRMHYITRYHKPQPRPIYRDNHSHGHVRNITPDRRPSVPNVRHDSPNTRQIPNTNRQSRPNRNVNRGIRH